MHPFSFCFILFVLQKILIFKNKENPQLQKQKNLIFKNYYMLAAPDRNGFQKNLIFEN
jgi:hypothetical protein